MTILLTGGTGQLATALAEAGGGLVRRVGRPGLDFDRPETVEAAFSAAAPSLVVNAAAYTGVDAAETDAEAAYQANRDGPALLARLCAEAGVPLIHVSTDYVFDGLKGAPYIEDDPPSPTGVYGASKLAGEQAVLGQAPARSCFARRGVCRDGEELRADHAWRRAADAPVARGGRPEGLPDERRRPRRRHPDDRRAAGRAGMGRPVRRGLPRCRERVDDVARPRLRRVRGGSEARDDPALLWRIINHSSHSWTTDPAQICHLIKRQL